MKRIVILLLIFIFLSEPISAFAKTRHELLITVSTSPQSTTATTISAKGAERLAKRILACKTAGIVQKPEFPRATITIGKIIYIYDSLGRLFVTSGKQTRKVHLPSSLSGELESWIAKAERVHYGEFTPWEEVRTKFPRMSFARVIDVETGQSFRVQRRAGSRHADVQPLTKADTATMKKIYQGKWSWRRRAILLEVNGKHYAASMNGMPHGAGAITGNDFRGHFCIHFLGSEIHKKKRTDPAHHMMILKSAGKLKQSLMHADPYQLVEYYLTALHEQDHALLKLIGDDAIPPIGLEQVVSIKWLINKSNENELLQFIEIPVKVNYIQENYRSKKSETWFFELTRSSMLDRWQISQILSKKQ